MSDPIADALPSAIIKELENLDQQRARIMEMVKDAALAEDCRAAFADEFPSMRVSIGVSVHAMQGVLLFVDVDDFRKLIPVRRWLRANGMPPAKKVEDYPELKRRAWYYGPITLAGFLPWAEDSVCQYVEVGTETKPVYKLMCGDVEVADEDGV